MASDPNSETVLKKAKEHERKNRWLEAAKSYETALHSKSGTASFVAETWQRIGFCFNQGSRQADDLEEFKKLRQLAVDAYKNAANLFEKEDSKNLGKIAQCNALAEFIGSWLAPNLSEKVMMLDACRAFGKKTLKAFKRTGDETNYVKSCNTLLLCLFECLSVAPTQKEKQIIAQEGIHRGNEAISILSKLENKSELLLANSLVSLLSWYAANINEREEDREKLANESLKCSEKAMRLSNEIDNPYYIAMSRWAAALSTLYFTRKIESSLEYAKEMLQQGLTVGDNYIKGIASYILAHVADWMVAKEADPEKKKEDYAKVIVYSEDATRYLELVSQDYYIAETYLFYTESYNHLGCEVEIEIEGKRALLKKAVEIGRKGLEHALKSGYPDAFVPTLHSLSKALHSYSKMVQRKGQKIKLLEEALGHRKEYIKIVDSAFPAYTWNVGVGKNYAGLIEAELARLETDNDKKIALLANAVSDIKGAISYCIKWINSRPVQFGGSTIAVVAEYENTFGGVLNELYLLTKDEGNLTQAIEVYREAAERFKGVNLPSRAAESYWKMARNEDQLGKHREAAKNFKNASINYRAAAKKIRQFADFYQDYAIYMEAWSEIETAKHVHKHEEYAIAMQHYKKTANLLYHSKLWSYLSANFQAWSLLEHAEDLSRQERSIESIESFKKASKLFEETKKKIEDTRVQLGRIEDIDEKEMVAELVKASDVRHDYCLGRTALEEAKILDKQGDHYASSGKYSLATEIFQKVVEALEHESDRQELRPIICLCRAWQMMTRAEAENSPDLYLVASQLFEEAKEHSSNEKAKMLSSGHSRFCKALEAGTRFEDSRDMKLHLAATQHLESASSYYIKAGFKIASEYAVATQRLFDGYIYMDNANEETDPEKKARYYIIAEKVLLTSAGSYMRAKHPEKATQVHRLLDRVRKERKLAASLSEVLHAPSITSSTASFPTPTPTHEKAVGLERFERANIQGHLTVPEEVAMEEDFRVQLNLANVAKNFGLLIRIDNLVPKGFRVTEAPSEYSVENGSIDMKGKRFDPLKVESIKISARATDYGIFKVNPQVVYVDEAGQFRTCRPEAVHVKVRAPLRRAAEERAKKRYELVYRDLLKECPRIPRSECRVAIAQIGLSKSGDVLSEFYEERATGLFGLRQDKVEIVRFKVKNMIEIANAKEINVLLFPELTIDLNYSQLLEDIVSLAKTYEIYIVPGSYHDQKTKRNLSVVIGPDGILWRQEKHIPAIIHQEGKRFKEGIDVGKFPRKTFVCNTEFGRIAIAICRDFLDMDLRVELKNFEPPVDIILNPAFTPVTADFKAVHFDARRSIYAYCFFANVAEFGDSLIYTPEKERVERRIPPREESLIYKDIDLFKLRLEREKWEKEKRKERGFIQSTR